MAVRKTESRLPEGFLPGSLGEAVSSPDGHYIAISFTPNPLVKNRENRYVVFVNDSGLASSVESYEWNFTIEGHPASISATNFGETAFTPANTGPVAVSIRLLNAANNEITVLQFSQHVVEPNPELEEMITASKDEIGPTIGDPSVIRELVNDHNHYYQEVSLVAPESGEGFKQVVFSTVYDACMQRSPERRQSQIAQISESLNGLGGDFRSLISEGLGVAAIRLTLLAMVLPKTAGQPATYLPFGEIPETNPKKDIGYEAQRQLVEELDENSRIDLFNLVRFPKSCINLSAKILETLRDHYFSGTNFNDVLSGMSGTRAHWLQKHYNEGPVLRE